MEKEGSGFSLLNKWKLRSAIRKFFENNLVILLHSCVEFVIFFQSHVTVKEANLYCELEAGNYSTVNALMDWNAIPKPNVITKYSWNTRHLLNEVKQNLLEKFVIGQENDYEQ